MKVKLKIMVISILSMVIFSSSVLAINNVVDNSTNNIYSNVLTNSSSSYAKENTPVVDKTKKIYDYANLLTSTEESDLYNEITEFINTYNMDMAVVTINENNKSSSMAYADDFYDYNDFGIGSSKSGLLFLIDMDNRNMWISTTGSAIQMYTDARIDAILDYTYEKISEQDYYGCSSEFVKYASYFAKKGVNGSDSVLSIYKVFAVAFGIGVFVTIIFIVIGVLSHRTVKKQKYAREYISKQLEVNGRNDRFITRNVSKTRRVESSSSGGGSSTHIGSSGTSHGGGGRSF